MKVTRDVILDLLPLYLSGEASADTGALVVEYLAQDTELAAQIRSQPSELLQLDAPVALPQDLELQSLQRARRLINLQKWLFGPAIFLTAVALSLNVKFENGHLPRVRFLMLDYPLQLGAVALLAVGCWVAYHQIRRSLRPLV